jgi:hypothetical protein
VDEALDMLLLLALRARENLFVGNDLCRDGRFHPFQFVALIFWNPHNRLLRKQFSVFSFQFSVVVTPAAEN